MFRVVSACCLILSLAGCASVGPDYQRPQIATPAQWNAPAGMQAADPSMLAEWWRQFHDAVLDRLAHRPPSWVGPLRATLVIVFVTFSVLALDIDHFKRVNDTWGHPAGDALLKRIGVAIVSAIRRVDLAARLGGDEFCVLLPETDIEGATAIAERIRAAVGLHIVSLEGLAVRATACLLTMGSHSSSTRLTLMPIFLKAEAYSQPITPAPRILVKMISRIGEIHLRSIALGDYNLVLCFTRPNQQKLPF